jgi:4-amino-4-deoxy-L-arabinose transferase-like glycosyltransferase
VSAGTFVGPPSGAAEVRPRARLRTRDATMLALGALVALAAVIRFLRIGHQGFWFDEGNTALLVHYSVGQMLGLIRHSESTPPLYYLLTWAWAHVFGYGEAPLRSLSALVGVLVVPVAYALGARLLDRRAGLIAAALAACNPLLIWYSQEARSYELLVLLSGLSLLAFLIAREGPSPRAITAWAIASALALATHYYALLLVVPEAVWLLALHRRRPPVWAAVVFVAAAGGALLPLALAQNATGHANWIATVSLLRRLSQVPTQFVSGQQIPAPGVLIPLAGAIALTAVAAAVWRGDPRRRRRALVAAGLALTGLVLNLLIIAAGVDDLLTRNLLALWLPCALTVTVGLRRGGLAGVLATVALCAVGLTGAIAVDVDRAYQRPDWRGVVALIGARPAAGVGERAILVQHYRQLLPLRLYLPGLAFMRRHELRHVREIDIVAFSSPPSTGFCWWGSACNLWPSKLQASYPIPGFHEVWRRRIDQFSVMRLLADRPRRITVAIAGHALTAPRTRASWELLLQP